ncbi:MAG: NAD(P)/FAD-dependent oxidoreductase [Desulfobulbaceae bacterium]|nr:NAD(P)/FAD-dependent oxidoreductase [Desulfobulbaceae bacterium]
MADVVVIGAGLGGLASGVRLLQRGHSVTLLEKEPRVGGYAVSFRRHQFTFDLALHVVPAGGQGQEFAAMIETLGLTESVRFIRLREGFRVHLGDYHFQMPGDYDALLESLSREFPAEKKGIQLFRKDLERYVTIYARVFDHRVSSYRSIPPFIPKIPAFLQHSMLPTTTYLQRFFHDERLMAILFQPAAFMGIPMRNFPTVNFMMMFSLLLKNGMYTIAGGGQRLTDSLQGRFLQLGGTLLTNTAAERIIIERKKAVAVRISDGRQLPCDAIIGGNNLHDMVNNLIGKAFFTERYCRNFDTLKPSISVLALNLGLDCSPKELGIDCHIAMVFPDADIDGCFDKQTGRIEPLGFSITAHGNSDPEFIEQGGNTLSLIGGTAPEMWLAMDDVQYRRQRKKVSLELLAMADKRYPGLKDHIMISDLATPRTMARYTGNPLGAIMGLNCTVGKHRNILKAAKMPVANVIMGSAWTNRLGGFMQSVKSGILAAERIQ